MEIQPAVDPVLSPQQQNEKNGIGRITALCVAGALIPGLGHALLRKWDRAIVFFACISIMLYIGLKLHGDLFDPDFSGLFATGKFIMDAGLGLLYWVPWYMGTAMPDIAAYTYDYANVFIWVAGLLNMLVIMDVFDIAMGRKQ